MSIDERPSLVVAANRLPVQRSDGEWSISPGGLVAALSPVLESRDGVWIGWSGAADEPVGPLQVGGIEIAGVPLSEAEISDYYLGFCNKTVWPLYHDAIRPPEYHRAWWSAYRAVNRRFADHIASNAGRGDTIWVHDYHLQLVPGMIRKSDRSQRINFFLHIPFPPVEIFARVPWRSDIINGLLGADVIGVQTDRSAENLKAAAAEFGDISVRGDFLEGPSHSTRVVAAPISIDVGEFERIAGTDSTARNAEQIRQQLGSPEAVILGADRLDYTKGIDVRLRSFEAMLESLPGLAGNVVFVQIAVPSRESIDDYAEMRDEIELIAGRINGMYGERHHAPVQYVYESLSREELVAYYRAADVMVVTPLADGMNLVAKEFVASRVDEGGVLVLSEFAGAAQELGEHALMVNPYDIDGMATELIRALVMDPDEIRSRMGKLRGAVRENDVHHWTRKALSASVTASRK